METDWQKALRKIRAVLYVHISEGVWAFLLINQRMRGAMKRMKLWPTEKALLISAGAQ